MKAHEIREGRTYSNGKHTRTVTRIKYALGGPADIYYTSSKSKDKNMEHSCWSVTFAAWAKCGEVKGDE